MSDDTVLSDELDDGGPQEVNDEEPQADTGAISLPGDSVASTHIIDFLRRARRPGVSTRRQPLPQRGINYSLILSNPLSRIPGPIDLRGNPIVESEPGVRAGGRTKRPIGSNPDYLREMGTNPRVIMDIMTYSATVYSPQALAEMPIPKFMLWVASLNRATRFYSMVLGEGGHVMMKANMKFTTVYLLFPKDVLVAVREAPEYMDDAWKGKDMHVVATVADIKGLAHNLDGYAVDYEMWYSITWGRVIEFEDYDDYRFLLHQLRPPGEEDEEEDEEGDDEEDDEEDDGEYDEEDDEGNGLRN